MLIGMVFGLGMYGVMYVLPVYLAQVQGYNAGQIGRTIMWSGVPQLLMMPVAAALAKRFDARLLMSLGLGAVRRELLHQRPPDPPDRARPIAAHPIDPRAGHAAGDRAPHHAGHPRHCRQSDAGSASALFNMLRNLGGSIGIALLATRLDVGEKLHSQRIGASVSLFSSATVERIQALTAHFTHLGADSVTATNRALACSTTPYAAKRLCFPSGTRSRFSK